MAIHVPNNSIAVDIDGTLLNGGTISAPVLQFCVDRQKTHCLTLWSARGEEYAKSFANKHGITHLFRHIMGKPSVIVDDKGWQWIRFTKAINPCGIRLRTSEKNAAHRPIDSQL